jgi:hypothetical protein
LPSSTAEPVPLVDPPASSNWASVSPKRGERGKEVFDGDPARNDGLGAGLSDDKEDVDVEGVEFGS